MIKLLKFNKKLEKPTNEYIWFSASDYLCRSHEQLKETITELGYLPKFGDFNFSKFINELNNIECAIYSDLSNNFNKYAAVDYSSPFHSDIFHNSTYAALYENLYFSIKNAAYSFHELKIKIGHLKEISELMATLSIVLVKLFYSANKPFIQEFEPTIEHAGLEELVLHFIEKNTPFNKEDSILKLANLDIPLIYKYSEDKLELERILFKIHMKMLSLSPRSQIYSLNPRQR